MNSWQPVPGDPIAVEARRFALELLRASVSGVDDPEYALDEDLLFLLYMEPTQIEAFLNQSVEFLSTRRTVMAVATIPNMAVPDISKLLDDYLVAQDKTEGEREITGSATWRASKLGSCLRAQFLEFHLKQPKLEEFSALTLKKFEVGHSWSRQFSKWFKEMGFEVQEEVELYDEELDVGAHGDYILTSQRGNKVGIELKSVQSRWFWHRTQEEESTATEAHMMQTACYDLLARKKGLEIPWMVVSVSKDDLTIVQDLVTEDHRDRALTRLIFLNAAKNTNTPPPCTCTDPEGNYNGSEWRYCGYYAGSEESKKNPHNEKTGELYANGKPKYKKVFKPDGACCEVTS
jgi:hypothetical protein